MVSAEWISFGVAISAVGFGFWQSWNKSSTQSVKDSNVLEAKVLGLYKDQIKALQDRDSEKSGEIIKQAGQIKAQEAKQKETDRQVKELYDKNLELMKLIQGRDPASLAYQSEGRVVFDYVQKELGPRIIETNNNISRLYTILDEHLKRLEELIKSTHIATTTEKVITTTQPIASL